MIVKYIGLVLSTVLLIGAMAWIARQCWRDSKDDFKMVFDYIKSYFKKIKAD